MQPANHSGCKRIAQTHYQMGAQLPLTNDSRHVYLEGCYYVFPSELSFPCYLLNMNQALSTESFSGHQTALKKA